MNPEQFIATLPELPDEAIGTYKTETQEDAFEKNLQYLAAISAAIFLGAFWYI